MEVSTDLVVTGPVQSGLMDKWSFYTGGLEDGFNCYHIRTAHNTNKQFEFKKLVSRLRL